MNLKKILLITVVLVTVAGGVVAMNSCASIGKRATGARLEAMKASPNWRDGKFVNPLSSIEPKLFESLRKWMHRADNTVPKTPLPVVTRAMSDFDVPPASGLRITWLGHSTLLVEIDNRRVLIDPVWSERPSPFTWMGPKRFHKTPLTIDELPTIDAVVISHDHYDHLDHRFVQKIGEHAPLYIAPLGVGAHLEYWGVSSDRIIERDWWEEVTLGDLTLTATPARHFSGRSLAMTDKQTTLWSGWVIAGPEHRIFYSGDTGMFPGFIDIGERLGPFDAVLIEIGAYDQLWADLHIGPEQAIQARLSLGSGFFIPVHWGSFELAMHAWTEPVERVLAAAEKAGVPISVPKPGESIEPANPPQVTRWWPAITWQTAEKTPVISRGIEQSQRMAPEPKGEVR